MAFKISQERMKLELACIDDGNAFPTIKLEGKKIPRILLGSSPFLAAGQFGTRSRMYHSRFVLDPENIVDVIVHCINIGVTGIQLIAYDFLSRAVEKAEEMTGVDMTVVGTMPFEEPIDGLKRLQELNAEVILLHGEMTGTLDIGSIRELVRVIRDAGAVPGVAVHQMPMLTRILELDVRVVMLPINKLGYMMEDVREALDFVERADRFIIAKKPLAAGRIMPRDGLEFVFGCKGVDAMAVGIASKEEANETFSIARDILSRKIL